MTDASPLTSLTHLKRLDVWLGANQELPMCSNKPLRGLLAAVGRLSQLTELQLLRGLYLSWELRKVVHLDGLTDLQVCLGEIRKVSGPGCRCTVVRCKVRTVPCILSEASMRVMSTDILHATSGSIGATTEAFMQICL